MSQPSISQTKQSPSFGLSRSIQPQTERRFFLGLSHLRDILSDRSVMLRHRHKSSPLPSSVLVCLLLISLFICPTSSNIHSHHRYHLPYTHHHHNQPDKNAQASSESSTTSPSTMLPHPFPSPSSFHAMANYSGDIMLGAVFPIHERDQNFSCGSLQAESLQQLEALVYSLKRINDDPNILPGIKLGVLVIDSCDSPHHALEQTIDFIKSFVARSNVRLAEPEYRCADRTSPVYKYGKFDRVLGLIGGQSSEVSLQLANLLRLFQVPQVSYMSTSPTLSDKRLYEYFFRTVPSDTNQVDAIVEILRNFGWTYVSVVYSDTEYGNNGYDLLSTAAARYNICISSPQAIDVERFGPADYDNLITTLMHKINARVVVVFTDRVVARKVMTAAKIRLGTARMDRFVWIASDAWCCRDFVVHDLEEVVEGSISVTPMSYPLKGFAEYFRSLRPENNALNPWFEEFWQDNFECILPKYYEHYYGNQSDHHNRSVLICDDSLSLDEEMTQYLTPSLHFVRDALYSFAMAFNRIHKEYCNGIPGICPEMNVQLSNGANLAKWLLQVQFNDEGNKTFRFQTNGDAPPRYRVVNYQQLENGSFQWTPVGTYMMSMESNQSNVAQLILDKNAIKFKSNSNDFPGSFCSADCLPGQAKLQLEGDTCCWLCTNCSTYQYKPDDFHCADCPLGTVPNTNKTVCLPLAPMHLTITNWWTISAILVSLAGMLCTILTWVVFCYYSETPIIKAAGRELSHLHLTGIFLSFAMTFVMISKPSALTCALNRFFLGFCYTVCYSAIVTKTNRIARIFRHRSCQPPRFTSPLSQLVITSLLITVEIVVNLFWIIRDPPGTKFVYPSRDKALLICSGSDRSSYLVGLLYPFVLIGFCTVYAFKTRKCPEGYNEARYITFTNYTTCVVWLAFLPLFVMLSTTTPLRYVTLCLLLSVSGGVQLACLFVPKVYIAVLKPQKNTRETVMCGGHYSRALYSSSVTNSNATINRRPLRLNTTQTTFTGETCSSSSEIDTTTTTALHNEATKQHSKDSQVETTSGVESGPESKPEYHRTIQASISYKSFRIGESKDKLRSGSVCSNKYSHNECNGHRGSEPRVMIPMVTCNKRQASLSISTPLTSTSSPPASPSASPQSPISPMSLVISPEPPLSSSSSQFRPLFTSSLSPSPLAESIPSPSSISVISNPIPQSTISNTQQPVTPSLSPTAHQTTSKPRSTSSPMLNGHEPALKHNQSSHLSSNGVGFRFDPYTKHETKAVLENGHEKWPSVKLNNHTNHTCVTSNGTSTTVRRH